MSRGGSLGKMSRGEVYGKCPGGKSGENVQGGSLGKMSRGEVWGKCPKGKSSGYLQIL